MEFTYEFGNAICYSGYREGQSPLTGMFPTYEQTKEDLMILAKNWKYIRVYDCSKHTEIMLDIIKSYNLDLKVMLGAPITAEMNNRNCPWGANYPREVLENNKRLNESFINKLIEFANAYPKIVFAVSVGNEASVDWSDHLVMPDRIIEFVKKVKSEIKQPVTFCENYYPWLNKLEKLAEEVDFISLHTYPAWEQKSIDEAVGHTMANYYSVADKYKGKPVIITEAGWTTRSNGQGIPIERASEEYQQRYYEDLMKWTRENKILTFVFEAFDEPWKGSPDSAEPEKYWGLFNLDRTPKRVMKDMYGKKEDENLVKGNVKLNNGDLLLGNEKYLAFSYGGYRENTRNIVPTLAELKEDMLILNAMGVKVLRTYNTAEYAHAERLLEAISQLKNEKEGFEMYVMLGVWIQCTGAYTEDVDHSREDEDGNRRETRKAVELAQKYKDIVKVIAVGNEAMVYWQAHWVSSAIILKWVNYLRDARRKGMIEKDVLITSSDNFATWGGEDPYKMESLVQLIKAVDYISLHTYPFHDTQHGPEFWETTKKEEKMKKIEVVHRKMERAMDYAKSQYNLVKDYLKELGIEKPIHIGETGWATVDNHLYGKEGTKIADEYKSKLFYKKMRKWTNENNVSCFYFEAFDEPWKDPNPIGSENHFGQFTVDGKAKYPIWDLVDQGIFENLTRNGNKITKTYDGDEGKVIDSIL